MSLPITDWSYKNAPQIVTEIPGPKSKSTFEQVFKLDSKCISYPRALPIALEAGKGSTLKDVDGNTYIDFYAGMSVMNYGYDNAYIMQRVKEQQDKLIHCMDMITPVRLEMLQKLNAVLPLGLKDNAKMLFPSPSGADAVNAAVRLAKVAKKRNTIFSYWGSFHGTTGEAVAVTAWTGNFKCQNLTNGADVHFIPFPYCYRCQFGKSRGNCSLECFEYLRTTLENGNSGACLPAAIIMEPVQGEGGIHIAPPEYLQKLRKITEEKGILLIFDEIQCGMGRTGKMWASEYSGVTPDIMTIAKGIGGTGLPLSCCVYKKELDTWPPGTVSGTFRGNVLGMAAGVAGLDYMRETNLLEHVNTVSSVFSKRLSALQKKYEVIGEIRQEGLMAAIEFVKDRQTKAQWKEFMDVCILECMKRGLLVWKAGYYFNTMRLLPPLVMSAEMLNKGMSIMDEAISATLKKLVP